MFSFGKQTLPCNWVSGAIVKTSSSFVAKFRKDKKPEGPTKKDIVQTLCIVDGKWNESMKIDGVEFYNMQRDQPCCLEQEPYPLNSNSNYREDIIYKRKKDITRAQSEK